ncbi:MAG: class I SAM-dependent methyltransferase [candidate division Zixibacteria bacterium]|nr:class I SAM-dependent methyltransferase [candidate division Zixibacteria bacterium]
MSPLNCQICNSTDFRDQPVRYLFNRVSYNLAKCGSCGLLSINPMPGPEDVRKFYSHEYFQNDHSCGIKAKSYFEDEMRVQDKAREALLLVNKYKTSGKLLEVGCAGGLFLREAQKSGFEVAGLDISEEIAREANEKFGLSIQVGDFVNHPLQSESVDVVCMFDVFEHFINPAAVLRKVKQILKPDGIVLIDIPTTKNALPYRLSTLALKSLNKSRTIDSPPYHVFEYTPTTLLKLLRKAGLKTLQAEKYSTPPRLWKSEYGKPAGRALLSVSRYANFLLSKTTGLFTDRLILIVCKQSEED